MSTAERYLKLMLCVLWADGAIHNRERKLFEQMLAQLGVGEGIAEQSRALLEATDPPDEDALVAEICDGLEASRLVHFIQDAYLMAYADKEIHTKELTVIRKVLLGVGIPRDRWEAIHVWALQGLAHIQDGHDLFFLDAGEEKA